MRRRLPPALIKANSMRSAGLNAKQNLTLNPLPTPIPGNRFSQVVERYTFFGTYPTFVTRQILPAPEFRAGNAGHARRQKFAGERKGHAAGATDRFNSSFRRLPPFDMELRFPRRSSTGHATRKPEGWPRSVKSHFSAEFRDGVSNAMRRSRFRQGGPLPGSAQVRPR